MPVVFTAGGESYPIKATTLGVEADWASALQSAAREGEGFGPVRGFRRLQARFFGAEVMPPVQAYAAALDYKLAGLAREIDRSHVEAKLVRRGLSIELVPGPGRIAARPEGGRGQDRPRARPARARRHRCASRPDRPGRGRRRRSRSCRSPGPARALGARAARVLRHALEASPVAHRRAPLPARRGQDRSWRSPAREPRRGSAKLRKTVEHAPVDAGFAVRASGAIEITPDKPGLGIDVPATAEALLAAATSPTARTATLAARTAVADRTVAEAQAMGITGVVGSYYTTYGGIASRLHNVALVAELIDGALIAPGKTFSFNGTTGERTAEKGFQEAPVIINGELQTGLGGGICQVSTTVFNAAYEAGLQIDERTNHALYISHYPLGRDATVNYPDLDLKFTNDTDNWLLLRTFVGSGSLTVNLYGTPQNRRVESSEQPLRVIGAPKVKRVPEPTWLKGKSEVLEYGEPARATSVSRMVYSADGTLLHEDTWYSQYRSEPRVIRVGTKPKPKPKTKPPKVDPLVPGEVDGVPNAPPASTPPQP